VCNFWAVAKAFFVDSTGAGRIPTPSSHPKQPKTLVFGPRRAGRQRRAVYPFCKDFFTRKLSAFSHSRSSRGATDPHGVTLQFPCVRSSRRACNRAGGNAPTASHAVHPPPLLATGVLRDLSFGNLIY